MSSISKPVDLPVSGSKARLNGAAANRGWFRPRVGYARALGVLGLGVAGLAFGGVPWWAARRIIHPMGAEQLPQDLDEALEVGVDARPEKVEFSGLDGHPLGGWFVPGPGDAPWPVVLLVYGY